jgi:hypothetical protein
MSQDQYILPDDVFDELIRFISNKYPNDLPNSLLIAQEVIIKYPEYGKEYGLSAINKAIEGGIKQGLFKTLSK